MKRLLGSKELTDKPAKVFVLVSMAALLVGCGGGDGDPPPPKDPDPHVPIDGQIDSGNEFFCLIFSLLNPACLDLEPYEVPPGTKDDDARLVIDSVRGCEIDVHWNPVLVPGRKVYQLNWAEDTEEIYRSGFTQFQQVSEDVGLLNWIVIVPHAGLWHLNVEVIIDGQKFKWQNGGTSRIEIIHCG